MIKALELNNAEFIHSLLLILDRRQYEKIKYTVRLLIILLVI